MKIRKLLLGFILIVGLFQNESMAQINYYINSQGIPINASAVEAKQRLANGENYLGEIRAYPSTTNPSSWIRADGRLLNINQYLPLYGMLQNRYGGDGINTFAVPKLVPIDADDSTNNVNWSIGGDKLKAIGLLGSLNNYNVQFIRNNVNQFSLTSTGIVSNVDYTTSGNVTLQKGNPRIRMRDVGAGGHINGFDLHVNGDEFLIDDNTHSRNIIRNYLNSSVHTTDFDAEVFNFKNGTTNYARLNNTGLFLNNLTTNYIPKHTANGLANSQIFDNGTTVSLGSALGIANKFEVGNSSYGTIAAFRSVPLDGINPYLAIKTSSSGITIEQNGSQYKNLYFQTSALDRLTILSGGNVGIGTTTPNQNLEVNGGITASGQVTLNTSIHGASIGTQATFPTIIYRNRFSGVDSKTWDTYVNNTSLISRVINDANSSAQVWQEVNRSGATISSVNFPNGNIGIGTTTPTLAKLQVNGAIYQQGADVSGVGIYTNGALRFLSNTNFIDFNNSGAANNISFRNGSGVRTDLFISSTGSVGIGPTSVNASAKLEVTSTTQGVLLPRMTTTQINAIASPANGLLVYNTTLNKICVYENTAWRQVTTTSM